MTQTAVLSLKDQRQAWSTSQNLDSQALLLLTRLLRKRHPSRTTCSRETRFARSDVSPHLSACQSVITPFVSGPTTQRHDVRKGHDPVGAATIAIPGALTTHQVICQPGGRGLRTQRDCSTRRAP